MSSRHQPDGTGSYDEHALAGDYSNITNPLDNARQGFCQRGVTKLRLRSQPQKIF